MLNPYKYQYSDEDEGYVFQTNWGLKYIVYFMDYSYMFSPPPFIETQFYTFNIEPIEGNWQNSPNDVRIANTIFQILSDFFRKIENAIIYVCDSADNI